MIGAGHTLQATALVHEAWLRLMQQHGAGWQNRAQFFAIAAQAMRRILVDHARRRQAAKRGSGEPMADVDELADVLASPVPDEQLVALDAALERLTALDERQAKVVELRFGGLSVEETGEVLELSPTTVKREWATARLWLFRAIREQDGPWRGPSARKDVEAESFPEVSHGEIVPRSGCSDACTDHVETRVAGDVKLGFPVKSVTTTTTGEGDKLDVTTYSQEVTELEITRLERSLFEIPAGFVEAKSGAEIVPALASGGTLADALFGSTADGSSVAAPKKAGVIRIGVLEPLNRTTRSVPPAGLRQELVSKFNKAPYEAIPLAGTSPAAIEQEASKRRGDVRPGRHSGGGGSLGVGDARDGIGSARKRSEGGDGATRHEEVATVPRLNEP